jgi:hypothetical protein
MRFRTWASIATFFVVFSCGALLFLWSGKEKRVAQERKLNDLRQEIVTEIRKGLKGVGQELTETPIGNRSTDKFGDYAFIKEHWGKALERIGEFAHVAGLEPGKPMPQHSDIFGSRPDDVSVPSSDFAEDWVMFAVCVDAIAVRIHEPPPFPQHWKK